MGILSYFSHYFSPLLFCRSHTDLIPPSSLEPDSGYVRSSGLGPGPTYNLDPTLTTIPKNGARVSATDVAMKHSSRSGNDSLEMRRDYLARLEVRSSTYIKQLHRNTADVAIHPARTSCLGNSHMPDTSRWMTSNRCFAEMCVESST